MRKIKSCCIILCICLLLCVFPVCGFAAKTEMVDTSVVSGCRTFEAQVPLLGQDKVMKTAQAGIVYETNSNTLLYAWNADLKLPPASLSKIMTCMLVLENCDIKEEVVVSESAMATIPKTSATLKLKPGERFTVDLLLYGLMVGSANDAAVVLAEHVAGSQEAFVAMMNQKAAELGCKDTYFANAHGLHEDNQLTTARDVARIVAAASAVEQFMVYFGETHYEIPATDQSEERSMETTNYMLTIGTPLYYDARVTGGRTGITSDSLRSIAVTAESGGLNIVAVVLGATPEYNEDGITKYFGNYEEAKQLLNIGFDSMSICQVLYSGQNLGQFHVTNGTNAVAVGPVNSASVVLPSDVKIEDLVVRYGNMSGTINAPVKAGEVITSAEVWYGSVCVAFSPVVSMNGSRVYQGSHLQENRYGGSSRVWVVILIILLVAALGFGGYLVARKTLLGVKNIKINRLYRRRRSDRRRSK